MRAAFYIATIERWKVLVNQQNLNPVRTKDEARKRGSNGGKASGEARRRKKSMQAAMQALMEHRTPVEVANELGLKKSTNNYEALAVRILYKALMDGDVRAAEYIRDTCGEKPVAQVKAETEISVSREDIALLEKVGARLNASNG